MSYQRIQPLPKPGEFDSEELRALSHVWIERKSAMTESSVYDDFVKKLQREWAIETGIIERLYAWDRGVTEVLIEQGIDASVIAHRGGLGEDEARNVHAMISDHYEIVDGLFDYVKGDAVLTEVFIRGLHQKFTRHQDYTEAMSEHGLIRITLEKGVYKSRPNSPRRTDGEVHEYCPPEFTQEEMTALVKMYNDSENTHSPEVRAAWLHHRFTQIHPFQDGNGRVARALASLVFLRKGLFPLVVREEDRIRYIDALEKADQGDLGPLVQLFSRLQLDAILKALGLEQQVQRTNDAASITAAAIAQLRDRFAKEAQERESAVHASADMLFGILTHRTDEVSKHLSDQLRTVKSSSLHPFSASTDSAGNDSDKRHYFKKQITDVAKRFNYFANTDRYRAWARISISTNHEFVYVVSIHGYGHGDTGILVATGFTYLRAPSEDGVLETLPTQPACVDVFQFNYAESNESIERRFKDWLEDSIVMALAEWKRTL
ncbi:MAG: Fic family protein [Candidatus Kapabacteria bacterium]|nr:Fic family protein [Candidatus Kapabacteria bacterium]